MCENAEYRAECTNRVFFTYKLSNSTCVREDSEKAEKPKNTNIDEEEDDDNGRWSFRMLATVSRFLNLTATCCLLDLVSSSLVSHSYTLASSLSVVWTIRIMMVGECATKHEKRTSQ